MTHIKTRALVGFMGLIAASFLTASVSTTAGCGSDDGGGAGSGGSTGGGGTTGGGGNTGGGAGTSGAGACAAASAALITDFGAGTSQVGATPYQGAQSGLTAPVTTTASGGLVITLATGAPSMMYPYAYVGLSFNACTSATAYTGVKFTASGTLNTGCTIQFSAVDKAHSAMVDNPLGTCTLGAGMCYPSAKIFSLPATPTDVTVLFTEQSGGGAAVGVMPVNPAELLNIQWQLNVPTDGCTGSVTIDNISFI